MWPEALLDEGDWIAASLPATLRSRIKAYSRNDAAPQRRGFGGEMEKHPAVYILASQRNGTLYVGVTSDLVKRVWEHKNDLVDGFSRRYGVHVLVYFELAESMYAAIAGEKQIKAGSRAKKLQLIESVNPEWNDLYASIV